ncbi:hypothetical protein NKH47_08150 [Mesorhizobium sp. M1060]|uniref:hypothetical protein n=1 Tax=Mesorhizobium sp. M1060 TaxID=2957052 RepID=UPI00333D3356
MPGPLVIGVLADAVRLVVSNPVLMPKADAVWVGGSVTVEFMGQASSPKAFAASTGNLRITNASAIVSVTDGTFGFPGPVQLDTGAGGPVVSFGTLSVWKESSGAPWIWVDSVRAALVDSAGLPANPNTVRGTDKNHESALKLGPNQQFFITVTDDGGLKIDLGALYSTMKIDAAQETPFVLDADKTKLSFHLDPASVKASAAVSTQHRLVAELGRVQATAASGLMRAAKPDSKIWSPVELRATALHFAGGWVRATDFTLEADLSLGRVLDGSDGPDSATILRAPGAHVSWELDLAGALAGTPSARFHYRKPKSAMARGGDIERENRHFGVRVKGLGSCGGTRPVLDADLLAIDLTAGRRFEYLAGKHVPVGTVTEASRLAPKAVAGVAIVDVPYADLSVRIEDDGAAQSPFELDTSKPAALTFTSPTLQSRPAGFSAAAFDAWELQDAASPARDFELNAEGLKPTMGETWLDDFRTKGNPRNYESVEHPGTTIAMDSDALVGQKPARFRAKAADDNKTKLKVTGIGSAKEAAAYSAFCIALGWAAVKSIEAGSIGKAFSSDNFGINFPKLDGPFGQEFVKKNSLAGLRVVFLTRSGGAVVDGAAPFKEFIDQNMPIENGKPPELFHLPFAMGLSVVLFANGKYVYELDQLPVEDPNKRPLADSQGIAYDFDTSSAVDPIADLDWSAKDWKDAVDSHPAVWPRANDGARAKLDPLQPNWRGLFLKGMPLKFLVPKIVETDFKWLAGIIQTVNSGLNLDYGWLDENGASWVGGFEPKAPIEVTEIPFYDVWSSVLRMYILDALSEGLGGKTIKQAIGLRFELPQVVGDDGKPLAFEGNFAYTPSDKGQGLVDITSRDGDGSWFSSKSIPGFDKIALRQVSTDFKDVLQFSVDLVASDDLAAALPALSSDDKHPLKAQIKFSLSGTPDAVISLVLPAEQRSTLFGKWPFTLRSITLDIGKAIVRVAGRIETGLPGLQSIGATLVISKDGGGNPHIDVELDEIKGELSFGGFKLTASVHWMKADGTPGSLPLTDKTGASERDLRGTMELTDPGLIGKITLAVRIGSQGSMPYWIAWLQEEGTLSLGIAQLRNPFLLFAHNADFQDGGNSLQKVLGNPSKSILSSFQPKGDLDKWLGKWKPSKSIGTTIAGGGMLHLGSAILSTDASDTNADHLTAIVYNDTGLFRIDAFAFLVSQYEVNFSIVVDWAHDYYAIGLQLPTMELPAASPQYSVQAGAIVLAVGINGRRYVRLSIGWPEKNPGGDDFDRDWDKATKVVVTGMVPINTFQGGMLISYEDGKFITFGIAIRVGWTWQPKPVGGGIADASADAGIMIGGVFILSFIFDDSVSQAAVTPLRLAWQSNPVRALTKVDSAALADMQAALEEIDRALTPMGLKDVVVVAQLYGDLWGNASVHFMGVTLVGIHIAAYVRFEVCGSLNKGIGRAWGKAGFSVSITILCVTYSTSAQMEITLKDGTCPVVPAIRSAAAFSNMLSPLGPLNQIEDING